MSYLNLKKVEVVLKDQKARMLRLGQVRKKVVMMVVLKRVGQLQKVDPVVKKDLKKTMMQNQQMQRMMPKKIKNQKNQS